ncbi:MAG: SDR family oxidoreductase [Oceanicaulis sp.]
MSSLKPLSEQTVVITGASSGIGLTTAKMAAERGANVILVSRNGEALKEIAEEITAQGGRADWVEADVGVRDEVRNVVSTVIERHGGFDTWINDAGVGIYATLEETTDEDHEKIFQTNYWGVVYGSTEALPHLKQHGGALITLGSISSDMPAPVLSAYTASKHAVKGFIDSLRMELIHEKAPVSVSLIKPSGIHTPFGIRAENYADKRSRVPLPVYHPELVAKSILYCAEHEKREIMIGESGVIQTTTAQLFPRLADKMFSSLFYKMAYENRAPRGSANLHEPGNEGMRLGDQDDPAIRFSPATELQMRPGAKWALIGGGLLAAGWLMNRRANA